MVKKLGTWFLVLALAAGLVVNLAACSDDDNSDEVTVTGTYTLKDGYPREDGTSVDITITTYSDDTYKATAPIGENEVAVTVEEGTYKKNEDNTITATALKGWTDEDTYGELPEDERDVTTYTIGEGNVLTVADSGNADDDGTGSSGSGSESDDGTGSSGTGSGSGDGTGSSGTGSGSGDGTGSSGTGSGSGDGTGSSGTGSGSGDGTDMPAGNVGETATWDFVNKAVTVFKEDKTTSADKDTNNNETLNAAKGWAKGDSDTNYIYIAEEAGKFSARYNDSNADVQINKNTVLYIPVSNGSVLTITAKKAEYALYTINDIAASISEAEATYTATSAGYLEFKAYGTVYLNSIKVTGLSENQAIETKASLQEVTVTKLEFDATEKTLTAGESSFDLKLKTVEPATRTQAITWNVQQEGDYVSLEKTSELTYAITPLAAGTATITAKAGTGTATCVVTVEAANESESKATLFGFTDSKDTFTKDATYSGADKELITITDVDFVFGVPTSGKTEALAVDSNTLAVGSTGGIKNGAYFKSSDSTTKVAYTQSDIVWVTFKVTAQKAVTIKTLSGLCATGASGNFTAGIHIGSAEEVTTDKTIVPDSTNKVTTVTDFPVNKSLTQNEELTIKFAIYATKEIKKTWDSQAIAFKDIVLKME